MKLVYFIQWIITAGAFAGALGYMYGVDNVCWLELEFANMSNTTGTYMLEMNYTEGALKHFEHAVKHCHLFEIVKPNCFYMAQSQQYEYSLWCDGIKENYEGFSWKRSNISWKNTTK